MNNDNKRPSKFLDVNVDENSSHDADYDILLTKTIYDIVI